ncbi:MAG TPA: ABC transporter substrate-binding protein [Beijerinckiaceae bacterium]|jgi:branched-chain amino acid transport system substrate-binding protein|nr:ABC transporter substrate-binding protein [Beijerinckiaceae bacterium]
MNWLSARLALLALLAIAALGVAACGDDDDDGGDGGSNASGEKEKAESGPIKIGAAVDQTKLMKFFDGPALAAAQIRADEINADGGVDGRKLEFTVQNTRLDPGRTKSVASDLVNGGADVMWVTCDVDWATPAVQEGINADLLTVAPCIGTDQMGPKRFGDQGKLAFSYGNVAQDEGAALAKMAKDKGWKSATIVTDKSIVYTQNACQAFKQRFEENGGKIAAEESFTEGDGTINSVVRNVNDADADTIAICATTQQDLPAFVSGVRGGGNKTPIIGPWSIDGAFWLPKSKSVSNDIYLVTYASIYGDDPNPDVRKLIDQLKKAGAPPATGGFVTGAAAIDGIAAAVKENNGSTDGPALAKSMEGFTDLETISGKVSFNEQFHSAFGREYRIIEIKNGKPHFAGMVEAGDPVEFEGG